MPAAAHVAGPIAIAATGVRPPSRARRLRTAVSPELRIQEPFRHESFREPAPARVRPVQCAAAQPGQEIDATAEARLGARVLSRVSYERGRGVSTAVAVHGCVEHACWAQGRL